MMRILAPYISTMYLINIKHMCFQQLFYDPICAKA